MLKKQGNLTEKCKKSFIGWKLPHTYVILTIILLVVVGLTYIVPGGEYDRVIDPANGKRSYYLRASILLKETAQASLIFFFRCLVAM